MSNIKRGGEVVEGLPVAFSGKVINGFGRGSKELGCPTANIELPDHVLNAFPMGVYAGWGRVRGGELYPVAASLGDNPYYGNDKKTLVWIILS